MKKEVFELIGKDGELETIMRSAQIIALTDATVLILGESGTGKELLAREIHQKSRRSNAPFVVINCAALPETLAETELFGHRKGAFTGAETHRQGRIQSANGGTLFLDEIGELPLSIQSKFLRFLEHGECQPLGKNSIDKIDTRIIAATNRDLLAEVKAGRFRQDLYYRLNIVPLTLPPLRHRKQDIKLLFNYFINYFSQQYQLDKPTYNQVFIQHLEKYHWHGNIRELRNLCERLILLHSGQLITIEHLPSELQFSSQKLYSHNNIDFTLPSKGINLMELEINLIHQALTKTYGNLSQAARLLGLSRDTLLYRVKKYEIMV
jgi:transcriptional regulator with PAS, ATPase and Fis domain